MFAQQLSLWLQRCGIHCGWVAAVAFLVMLTMSAVA